MNSLVPRKIVLSCESWIYHFPLRALSLWFFILNIIVNVVGILSVKRYLEAKSIPSYYVNDLWNTSSIIWASLAITFLVSYYLMICVMPYAPKLMLGSFYKHIGVRIVFQVLVLASLFIIAISYEFGVSDSIICLVFGFVLAYLVLSNYFKEKNNNENPWYIFVANVFLQLLVAFSMYFLIADFLLLSVNSYSKDLTVKGSIELLLIGIVIIIPIGFSLLLYSFNLHRTVFFQRYPLLSILIAMSVLTGLALTWALFIREHFGERIVTKFQMGNLCAQAQIDKEYIHSESRYTLADHWQCTSDTRIKQTLTCIVNIGIDIPSQDMLYVKHRNQKKYTSLSREHLSEYELLEQQPTKANGCELPKVKNDS